MNDQVKRLLASDQTGNWLKKALKELLARDCVDAMHDIETLAQVMTDHCRRRSSK